MKNTEEELQLNIHKVCPELTEESKITFPDLLNYRLDYIKQMISTDPGKVEQLNETIVQSIKDNTTITDKPNPTPTKKIDHKTKIGRWYC